MTNSEYGQRLRDLRGELGLSLREVEERGGPSKDVLSPIERGLHKPRTQTLGKIAQAFGMNVTELRDKLEATYPKGPLSLEEALAMSHEDFGRYLDSLSFQEVAEWREILNEECNRRLDALEQAKREGRLPANAVPKNDGAITKLFDVRMHLVKKARQDQEAAEVDEAYKQTHEVENRLKAIA